MFSVRIFPFLFYILLNSLALATNTSNSKYCAISKHHLLCDDPPGYQPRCPKKLYMFPQTTSDRKAMLDVFNSFRNDVAGGKEVRGNVQLPKAAKLRPMKWSYKLEQAAINLMNDCNIYDRDLNCWTNNVDWLPTMILNYHDLSDYATLLKERQILLRRMVDVAVRHPEDVKNFNRQMLKAFKVANFEKDKISVMANERIRRVGGHVMGIITQVGNSQRFIYNMTFVIASVVGINFQPIYEVGEPCSQCPKCSDKYENLCDCSGSEHQCEPIYVDPDVQCNPKNTMLGQKPTVSPERIKALNLHEHVDLESEGEYDHLVGKHDSRDHLSGDHGHHISMNGQREGIKDFGNIQKSDKGSKKKNKKDSDSGVEGEGGDEDDSSSPGNIMSLNIFLPIPVLISVWLSLCEKYE